MYRLCSVNLFLLVMVFFSGTVGSAAYIADEEYPWYMHEEHNTGAFSMLIMDNSNYMSSEILYNNGTPYAFDSSKVHGVEYISSFTDSSNSELRCMGYNLLAYNPNHDYEPWKGVDIRGVSFPDYRDTSITTYSDVRREPYFPKSYKPGPYGAEVDVRVPSGSAGDTTNTVEPKWDYGGQWAITNYGHAPNSENLENHVYFKWKGNPNSQYWYYSSTGSNSCESSPTKFENMSAEEKGNYANWFAYYRTRRHVMRAIASNIIAKADGKIGMNISNASFTQSMWGPITDLENESKAPLSDLRKTVLHAMYHISGRMEATSGSEGGLIKALGATYQYIQHGGKTVSFGIGSNDFQAPPTYFDTTAYTDKYGGYDAVTFERPLLNRTGDKVCSVGRMLMISPTPYLGDGEAIKLGNSWAFPCAPSAANVNTPNGLSINCYGGQAGFGDVDGMSNQSRYHNSSYMDRWVESNFAGPPFDVGNYQDAHTLADIAMHYFIVDISITGSNNPSIREDDSAPYLITDMAGFGVSTSKIESGYDGSSGWNNPLDASATLEDKLDDMYHATVNTGGVYISPPYPAYLLNILANSSSDANAIDGDGRDLGTSKSGSVTKVGMGFIDNSIVPVSTTRTLNDYWYYIGEYKTGEWSGDLKAYHYSQTDNAYGTLPGSAGVYTRGASLATNDPVWSAEENLTAVMTTPVSVGLDEPWETRNIYTKKSSNGKGVDFVWNNLSNTDKSEIQNINMVDIDENGSIDTDDAKALIDYIRGDKSNEGLTLFRKRVSFLGDVINTTPTFVEGSSINGRDPMVYAGFNDGMLHGFNAKTGEEVFSYIPSILFPDLYKLSLTGTNYKHRMMVDGPITTETVGSKQILFGGLGHGGIGYYALDVTDPKADPDDIVLWEIEKGSGSLAEYSNLGYSFGEFQVIEIKGYGKVGVIPNGYESSKVNANAALYLVDLSDGSMIAESVISGGKGLSTPAIKEIGSDFYAYAGDLNGDLWKFKITISAGAPIIQRTSVAFYDGSSLQPITSKPAVINHHPEVGSAGALIAFGTGKYLTKADHNDGSAYAVSQLGTDYSVPETQSIIVLGDTDIDSMANPTVSGAIVKTPHLEARTYNENGVARFAQLPTEGTETNYADWNLDWFDGTSGTKYGWYMDLITLGERVISTPYLSGFQTQEFTRSDASSNKNPSNYQGGLVLFSTLIPGCNECDNETSGWVMALRAFDGRASYMSLDTNGDNVLKDEDSDDEEVANTPSGENYCGLYQGSGAFAVSGFVDVDRNINDYEIKYDADNKPNGDSDGTIDLVGTAAGSTSIFNLTFRSDDFVTVPGGVFGKRRSWKELTRK